MNDDQRSPVIEDPTYKHLVGPLGPCPYCKATGEHRVDYTPANAAGPERYFFCGKCGGPWRQVVTGGKLVLGN
jgi:hypothetical protein